MTTTHSLDYTAIKAKQQATWAAGDYSVIGTTLQLTGELLCEAVDVSAGDRVLDVAAGNGNASLAAARRGCAVVASDYVPELLEKTRLRAEAEGLPIQLRAADAEALPFDAGSFDAVLSTFGVMFTPDRERAAAELLRVCRPSGRIGVAAWTPDGFVGRMLRLVGSYVPPPAGVASPLDWGRPEIVNDLLGRGAAVTTETLDFVFRYRSAQDWLHTFRSYYGPMNRAFGALDADGRQALERDLLALADTSNTATSGRLRIPSSYLQTIATTTASGPALR